MKFPKLDPKAHYGELISQLKTCLEKDSNINVCALSAQCIRGIAAGLRKDVCVMFSTILMSSSVCVCVASCPCHFRKV